MATLAERCPLLTDVSFRACQQLTDASIVALTECYPKLIKVNHNSDKGWQQLPS